MSDMTSAEAHRIDERLDKIDRNIERLTARVDALPDKAAIYTASLAIHGVIWGTIVATLGVTLTLLNLFGAFR